MRLAKALDANSKQINNLLDGSVATDAATYGQIVPKDGWIKDLTNTWVFVSATTGVGGGLGTFKIVGVNATAYLYPGVKVSWNDGSVQYGVIVSSTFSTDTTITLAMTSDFTLSGSAITAPRYSLEYAPQGFPSVFNWSPTVSGWLIGAHAAVTGVSSSATPSSDSLLTKTAHGLVNGTLVKPTGLSGTTGITNGTSYFLVNVTTNAMQFALAFGGAPITLGGTQDTNITITPQAGADPPGIYQWVPLAVGSLLLIQRHTAAGTSSATVHSITLPATAKTLTGMQWGSSAIATDNGIRQAGSISVATAGTVMTMNGLILSANNTPSGSSFIGSSQLVCQYA